MTLNDLERRTSPNFAFFSSNSIALQSNYFNYELDSFSCANMDFLRQGFRKLSSDRHACLHTDRHANTTDAIYHASSRVVRYTLCPKKSFFTVLFIQTSDYYVISEETNCNCCTAAYLFSYCCLLLPIICIDWLFSGSPTFGGTQHYLLSDLKVLHFTR